MLLDTEQNLANSDGQPDAKPKENGVGSYDDVLYGSMGDPRTGMMLTGVSDRHVGLAQLVRVR